MPYCQGDEYVGGLWNAMKRSSLLMVILATSAGIGQADGANGQEQAPKIGPVHTITYTTVGTSTADSTYGQAVTLYAVVGAYSLVAPAGTVVFEDGGVSLGSVTLSPDPSLSNASVASLTVSSLSAATHSITAMYPGNGTYNPSTSPAVPLVVEQCQTGVGVGVTPSPAAYGLARTVTATVEGVSGCAVIPTGQVQFSNGYQKVTLSLNGAGTATWVDSQNYAASGGALIYGAAYLGSNNFAASTGSQSEQIIDMGVNVSMNVSPTSVVYSQPRTVTVNVSALSRYIAAPTGTVDFLSSVFSGGTAYSVALNGSGQASWVDTANVYPSAGLIYTARYDGDSNFPSTLSYTQDVTISKAQASIVASSSTNPSYPGQPVTIAVAAGPVSPATAAPTGIVELFDGSNMISGSTLLQNSSSSSAYSFVVSNFSVGAHSLSIEYFGDNGFLGGGTTQTLTQTVTQATPTITLTSSANPAAVGQSVTFTATLAGNYTGAPVPQGIVAFYDGSTLLTSGLLKGLLLVNGAASFTTSTLSAGVHSISVVYAGDGNFKGASSAVNQTVGIVATQTALAVSPNPTLVGQPVNFTATVTAPVGTPTGTFTFKDGSTVIVSGVPLAGGMGTYQTTSLSAGAHTVTAVYSGDSNFSTSTSSPVIDTVYSSSPATTTTLVSSANPAAPGQSVTFTATVTTSGAGTPTGTVTWWDGSTELGSFALVGNTASLSISTLSLGTHSITAGYGGDIVFAASKSAVLSQKVGTATATTTSLISSVNPSTAGQSVTFTATVTPNGSGTPTGQITFADGATTLSSASLSGGQASYTTSSLSAGAHAITAAYGGSTNFSASTSAVLSQTVNPSTSISLSSSRNPAAVDQLVTFTATVTASPSGSGTPAGSVTFATVTASSSGSGTPAGSVTFEDGGTVLGSENLSGGTASYATSSLSAGPHAITAVYGGNASFGGSTSPVLAEIITGGASTTTTYYFAHLAVGGGWQTTLTYLDYSPQSIACQTTFYSDSGELLVVPFTDVTTSVRSDYLAGGADIHVQTQSTAALLTGWALAQCSGPVKASLLYRLITNGVAQGEASVNAVTDLATEFVSFAQMATGVAYANPSPQAANLTLTVLDNSGNNLGNETITLQPNEHSEAVIGSSLGLASFTGSVQLVSTQPITAVFLNAEAYPVISSLPPADLPSGTKLAAVAPTPTPTTYYFAHLAVGGGWQTTLTYVNYSPQSTTCQTTFYSDSGEPLLVPFTDVTNSVRSDVLAGGADIHVQTQSTAALLTGWALAQCSGPVKASLLYRLITNGVAQGEASVNAVTGLATEFVSFAQTATGVAYANPSPQAANLTLTVLDNNGNNLGSETITLQPNEHSEAVIGSLLGLASFTGSVQLASTQPITAVFLNAEAYPVISSLPPADLPSGTKLAGQP
jgi:hypothetical protein